jgi:dynein light intermediate chain 1
MAVTASRVSSNAFLSTQDGLDRRKTKEPDKKKIWSTLLNSVSTGKRLAEKQLIVLGGSPESQREFLESISTESTSSRRDRQARKPPIANQFALGYTYQDVLDADHEDILARMSVYTLSEPSPSYGSLLKPLLTPRMIPNTLIVILLDWNQPWNWVRQLRSWIRLLRSIVASLDDESKIAMEETLNFWRSQKRTAAGDGQSADTEGPIPLGPGELDEPLGVPLSVVCQNADRIEQLEKDGGWKEEQFDFVLQFIRTILLKHGASLIYTMPSAPGSLQTLIHTSLGIQSTLQKKQLKHNVTDRDHILVPPSWDSWGKIRILIEGFDVEGASKAWSQDIQPLPEDESTQLANGEAPVPSEAEEHGASVELYESIIRDPKADTEALSTTQKKTAGIEVSSKDVQTFLGEQLELLDQLRIEDEREKLVRDAKKSTAAYTTSDDRRDLEEHIGPVQFNMDGIQVDADDILKRLKVRRLPTKGKSFSY